MNNLIKQANIDDVLYNLAANVNTEEKPLATEEFVNTQIANKPSSQIILKEW